MAFDENGQADTLERRLAGDDFVAGIAQVGHTASCRIAQVERGLAEVAGAIGGIFKREEFTQEHGIVGLKIFDQLFTAIGRFHVPAHVLLGYALAVIYVQRIASAIYVDDVAHVGGRNVDKAFGRHIRYRHDFLPSCRRAARNAFFCDARMKLL